MKTATFANIKIPGTRSAILVCLFAGVFTFNANAGKGGGKLEFKNPVLVSGTAGADGAVYKFAKVESSTNALVKIKSRSNSLVYLANIDMVTSGFDKAWQPQVGYNGGTAPGAADWWMEFEVTFVDEKTGQTVTIDEFDLSAIDIDGNGDKIREYISFFGPTSYTVESSSLLGISTLTNLIAGLLSNVGVRFDGPTRNFLNIDTSGTAVMATAKYLNKQSFTIRTGAVATGANGAADRMYSLYFQEFKYKNASQATLPVKLNNFDARVNSLKVNLDWSTAEEINFSHFVVQRSTDGKDFSDAAMIMSDAHSIDYRYTYTENFNQNAPAIVYYRLKMVDMDGTYKYSNTRIVKLSSRNNEVSITTYPNPVSSELRITVPSNWQNKEVKYDVVSLTGNVVKRKIAEHASQTETMQLGDLKAGVYVIRLQSGENSAVQQVVKN